MIKELDWETIKPPKLKKDEEEKPDWQSIKAPIYQYKPSTSEVDKKALNEQFQDELDWEKIANPETQILSEEVKYSRQPGETKYTSQPELGEVEGTKLSAYQEPEKSILDKVKASILGIFKSKPETQIAKAQVSYNISQMTGKPITEVEKNLPAYTKALGVRGIPTSEEFLSAMFTFPVTAALISNPITTGIGITKFMAMVEAENYIISKIKNIGYKFGAGKGLKELTPDDTSQMTKDIVDVIDFLGKGYLIAKTDKNIMKIWDRFTKDVTTKYSLPKKMYLSVDKIKDMHLNAKEAAQFEKDIYASVKGKADLVRKAFRKGGVDIEIPASEMITFADKPWYSKLKQSFGVKPFSQTIINKAGEVKLPTLVIEGKTDIPIPILPITGKGKVSKIAASINTKAIEQGLTKDFGHLAEYTPIAIKEQAQNATNLINTNIDEARKIIRGEKPLPEGLRGTALITAMEEHIKKTADGELASELASSPLVSGTSAAAQELRLAAERDPESPVKAIQDINKLLEETAQKRYPKRIFNKAKENVISNIKNEIKKANSAQSWQSFIESIRC